jgi:hypothetical protein
MCTVIQQSPNNIGLLWCLKPGMLIQQSQNNTGLLWCLEPGKLRNVQRVQNLIPANAEIKN